MAEKKNAAAAASVPYVRVTTDSTERALACAGALWAGVSEVPLATLTAAQLVELRLDQRLMVEEFDRQDVPAAAAA